MSWFSIPPFGTGSLVTFGTGNGPTHTPVTSPISLFEGNAILIDNENNALISGGFGTYEVVEYGRGGVIGMVAGSQLIKDFGGGVTINGGNGPDEYVMGGPAITADTLNLGASSNNVFLGGSGNTINASQNGGHDFTAGANFGNDRFSLSPTSSTMTIRGFTLNNGDKLDLSRILPAGANHRNLSDFVTVTTSGPGQFANTHLRITGSNGNTDFVTLLHSGEITLAQLKAHHSLIL